jgi:hypothetical protein
LLTEFQSVEMRNSKPFHIRGGKADAIRRHVAEHYIAPAREAGSKQVEIKVGDVHAQLQHTMKLGLICSSVRAVTFRRENNLELVRQSGAYESSSTTFTFELL